MRAVPGGIARICFVVQTGGTSGQRAKVVARTPTGFGPMPRRSQTTLPGVLRIISLRRSMQTPVPQVPAGLLL